MPSTALVNRIKNDFAQFTFVESATFRWSPESQIINLDPTSSDVHIFLLHELGHALLSHQSYARDIDLLRLERDAWQFATTELAPRYALTIDEDFIQSNLDTYRDWLHARSLCPSCAVSGLQSNDYSYTCLACGCHWTSNEARNCALRRNVIAI